MSTDGYFAKLMDGAPDALVVFDQSSVIRFINKRAEQLFGYAKDELHDGPLSQLAQLGPAQLPSDETPSTLALDARHKAGRTLPLEVAIARIDAPVGVLFSATFRGSRRSPSLVPSPKAEFLANMSHELRSPLNVIIGFAKLMYRGRVGALSDQQREYLGDMLDSAEHLLQLVNDLVDLSKLEAGRMDFHPEPVNLDLLLHEVREGLDKEPLTKHIPLDMSVAPECVDIELDPYRLKQILGNALCHALKLTATGGSIQLQARLDEADQLRFDIRCDVHAAAKPDVQANRHHAEGGLSLALAQRLVEQQGGRAGVGYQLDQSSTYFVVLPRRPKLSASPA